MVLEALKALLGLEIRVQRQLIDMDVLLEGLSLQSDANEATFCNLYNRSGISLTNKVLGGTSSDVNLLDALKDARFEEDSSYEQAVEDFSAGREGVITFNYRHPQPRRHPDQADPVLRGVRGRFQRTLCPEPALLQ